MLLYFHPTPRSAFRFYSQAHNLGRGRFAVFPANLCFLADPPLKVLATNPTPNSLFPNPSNELL
ncbi:hypothetical protein HOLleu_31087 [Holothuria leucospilota]|uniref:Uncharacterized protein n=1 Tax=Holothuria leucospilota TaxID=206669 RepID=A0A9Q1H1N3_HOLLE|nr:hypothetical protein HOLleu_31087 [Holothuria leucospilota]